MNRQDVKNDVSRIMDIYGELIFKTCFMMVKNKYDAEDIVQDTFMKYISHLADGNVFASDEHKKAWLLRVSQNKCKDLLKYKNRHRLKVKGRKSYSMQREQRKARHPYSYQAK